MRNQFGVVLLLAMLGACATTPAANATRLPSEVAADLREAAPRELAAGCANPHAREFVGRTGVAARELAGRYLENEAGFTARDADRVMRLRHPEFHTIVPNGSQNTREQMAERTARFISRVESFECLSETIMELALEGGDTAHAIVDQRTVRKQRFPDGTLHDIRTWVVQRETWKRVDGQWMMWRVDEIQPGWNIVDNNAPTETNR